VETALAGGAKVVAEVQNKAEHALEEHTYRRIWLAATLVPILLVIALLLLYIRSLPAPNEQLFFANPALGHDMLDAG